MAHHLDIDYASVDRTQYARLPFSSVELKNQIHVRELLLNTCTLNVAESGSANQSTILFLHGLGGTWSTWAQEMALLGASHRCIAFDLPGHGDSTRPAGRLNADVIAELAVELLGELEIGESKPRGSEM